MCWRLLVLPLLATLLCLGVGQVASWQAVGNYHNDANPGKCTITETLIIAPGEKVKSPDSCAEIDCHNEAGDVTITGCGSTGAPDGCEWGDYVDEQAAFPECCARYLNCVGGLNNETQRYQQHIWEMFSPNLKHSATHGAAGAEKQ
ncbi:PREDICTED: uncharacterized protein LOC108368877 [Rhagoletis zephyria]|uniref:uncharacterized protein LOC108368877 n=1 Tax=Rhagoletis zephyria TaxID=28612 RepID=UPI000811501C|nr:PREDICTED: uncharacterized protein LOC108368877 [Rhagoletis zephyria]